MRFRRKLLRYLGALVASYVVMLLLHPAVAAAAGFSFDPTQTVGEEYQRWVPLAQSWAVHIYAFLIGFEFVAIAITCLLYRDNLGEFFATVGFKIFLGGVYMWFVANAGIGGWPQKVIQTFTGFGLTLGGAPNLAALTGEGLTAAGLYFTAPVAAEIADTLAAGISGTCVDGFCEVGLAIGTANQYWPFTFVCDGLALIIVGALAAIFLQFVLITIESYIVMGAGILYIGFAGSRFTASFAQGYFGYFISVGTKLMVLYIVLGIEQELLPPILTSAAETLASSAIPFAGQFVAILPAAIGAFDVVIAAALVWMLPGLASSFLTGQSTASGAAVLSQAVATFASAGIAGGQMGLSQSAGREADHLRSGLQQGHQSASPSNPAASAGGANAPLQSQQSFSQIGGGSSGSNSSSGGALAGNGNGPQPVGMSGTSQSAYAFSLQGADTGNGTRSTPQSADEQRRADLEALQRDEALERMNAGYALSTLGQGLPHDIGAPSAVQVRLSNPDRL